MACYKIFTPFPSFKIYHYQNDTKCKTLLEKISLPCMRTKIHFHIKSFPRSVAVKQWIGTTRQWSVCFGIREVHTLPCFSLAGFGPYKVAKLVPGCKTVFFCFLRNKMFFREKKNYVAFLSIKFNLKC